MKIEKVIANNKRKAFEVQTDSRQYIFPYAKVEIRPSPKNRIRNVYVDAELGSEAFSYQLESGDEGTVHIDHVLEYNRDPNYLRNILLYKLTLDVQKRVEESSLSKREIIRRLKSSPAQFYRLLDQTNYSKSIDQLTSLLDIIDYDVDFVVRKRVGYAGLQAANM